MAQTFKYAIGIQKVKKFKDVESDAVKTKTEKTSFLLSDRYLIWTTNRLEKER